MRVVAVVPQPSANLSHQQTPPRKLVTAAENTKCQTNKNSGDVVVKDFSNDEITSVVFINSGNELRPQLLDGVVYVERQQVADRLLVITRHEYHTWVHTTQAVNGITITPDPSPQTAS